MSGSGEINVWHEISGQDEKISNADVGLGRNNGSAGKSCVCWYGHVLRKDKNNLQRRALDLRLKEARKRGRSKKT